MLCMIMLCLSLFTLINQESPQVVSMDILNFSTRILVTSVDLYKASYSSTLTCLHGWFSFFNFVRINWIILTGDHLYAAGNIHRIILFAHTKEITEAKPWMEVILYKEKSIWRSSSCRRLVLSTVVTLGKVPIFL